MGSPRLRRTVVAIVLLLLAAFPLTKASMDLPSILPNIPAADVPVTGELADLPVKGRAPKTGYTRSQFGDGWDSSLGCDTRNRILARDLRGATTDENCRVLSGTLYDPYTAKIIRFTRGEMTSDDVQIDHVVALSNAWQTGAQQLTFAQRVSLANDPLELLAVDGEANQLKSDGDAATWLPTNKPFRCQYVKRQIAVKKKYQLWVTTGERDAMARVLADC